MRIGDTSLRVIKIQKKKDKVLLENHVIYCLGFCLFFTTFCFNCMSISITKNQANAEAVSHVILYSMILSIVLVLHILREIRKMRKKKKVGGNDISF